MSDCFFGKWSAPPWPHTPAGSDPQSPCSQWTSASHRGTSPEDLPDGVLFRGHHHPIPRSRVTLRSPDGATALSISILFCCFILFIFLFGCTDWGGVNIIPVSCLESWEVQTDWQFRHPGADGPSCQIGKLRLSFPTCQLTAFLGEDWVCTCSGSAFQDKNYTPAFFGWEKQKPESISHSNKLQCS